MIDRGTLFFVVVFVLFLGHFQDGAYAQESRRYGDEPAPKYEMIPMNKYDMVPMTHEESPTPGNIPATEKGSEFRAPSTDPHGVIPTDPGPPQEQVGVRFQGIYFTMEGKTLHKWDFLEDGTFLHQIVAGGGGTGVRNSERGTYVISGDGISLKIARTATAFSTPGLEDRGRRNTVLGGGANEGDETRKVKFSFVGSKGVNGIILDGVVMKPRKWQ